jgi:hypothetical protein
MDISIERRQRARIGALALIGVGGYTLLQQVFGFDGQLGLLAAGVLCLAVSLARPQFEKLIVPGGLLIGFGLGMVLTSDQLPTGLHTAIHVATFALGFGVIYALGSAAYRWAKKPALALSALAGLIFLFSLPGEPMRMWWPILLVGLGAWIMRRERRRQRWAP